MTGSLDGRVAIVTGAGNGLGRAHALGLAARGARVVVNDYSGAGNAENAAQRVAEEIAAAGGQAIGDNTNVTDFDQVMAMVAHAREKWNRVDILVNNAGILRDKSFANSSLQDFGAVLDVHLMGSVHCSKAVWPIMREQGHGRIVMTTSSSGLYGNFGQANYAAAKMSVVGLMNTLHIEGEKYGIKVNTLAPTAATQMMKGLVSETIWSLIKPEAVTPALLFLVSDQAPSRVIMSAGAGGFAVVRIQESRGVYLRAEQRTPENIAKCFSEIADFTVADEFTMAAGQSEKFTRMAALAEGISLDS